MHYPHRDKDFWSILKKNKPRLPFKPRSHKVWIPLYGCKSSNSMLLYRYSNKENLKPKYN